MTDIAAYSALGDEMRRCTACPLCTTRHQVVVDRGDPNGRLLFIGEAPGATEDAEGRAFVGEAGALLDELIGAAGLTPQQYLIINVLKCRPPGNNFPGDQRSIYGDDIVPNCLPWLDKQIALVRPRVIVLVGRKAVEWTIYRNRRPAPNMKDLAFRWFRSEDYPNVEIFTMYHTAYLLRLRQDRPGDAQRTEEQTREVLAKAADVINDGTIPDEKPTTLRFAGRRPQQGRFF